MKELLEYRVKLIERLDQAAHEFCSACEAISPVAIAEGDWTLHQMAAHVRDIDRVVYSARVRRTLAEENPLFESINPDDWMADHYEKDEPLKKILSEFQKNIYDLCRTLNQLPVEAWSRQSRHETLGEGLTLQLWVERGLAHIEEHLNVLKKLI